MMKWKQSVAGMLILTGAVVFVWAGITPPSGSVIESYETTESNSLIGKSSGFQIKQAQQFYLDSGDTQPVSGIGILLNSEDYGSPAGDITVEMYTNQSGNIPGDPVGGTLKSFTPVLGQWNYIAFEGSGPTLNTGSENKYWIVASTVEQSGNDAYKWHRSTHSSDYGRGYRKTFNTGGSGEWSGAQAGDFAFRIYGDASLNVTTASQRAVQTREGVEISWKTESEQNVLGFNVLRGDAEDGDFSPVNALMIRAKGRAAFGADYSYVDRDRGEWRERFYVIEELLEGGTSNTFGPVRVVFDNGEVKPGRLELLGSYPNPFNPSTRIQYCLPAEMQHQDVRLTIYDIRGRQIADLAAGTPAGGVSSAEWDGCDSRGKSVASGLYICCLSLSSGRKDTIRLMKTK